jgi:regulator of telomere elongation helicase 1
MYFKNKDNHVKSLPWEPMDIEELHTISKQKLFCPYYAMKDRAAGADVIFMPYNYLVDEKIRENFSINFENCVMIFDEAHNITSTCEDTSSFTVETKMLEQTITELTELQDQKHQCEDKEL